MFATHPENTSVKIISEQASVVKQIKRETTEIKPQGKLQIIYHIKASLIIDKVIYSLNSSLCIIYLKNYLIMELGWKQG